MQRSMRDIQRGSNGALIKPEVSKDDNNNGGGGHKRIQYRRTSEWQ
jgi:hypothetical protein